MLQVDGSPHDSLEGRGPSLCLIGAIDDATGKVPRAFFEQAESSWAYFRLFSEIFKKEGLCQSIYCDRHSIFWTDREPTIEEQLKNQRPTTEVGRGLEELGVTLILAGSPQAKGRIERLWGTFQDRLVSELRRAQAKNIAQAQAVLDRYLSEHNLKFAKPPANAVPAWRKSVLNRSNSLCASSSSARWPRITPSASKEASFRSPRHPLIAPTPTRESMSMCCWMVPWSFSTKTRKSLVSTPKQRTQLAYIERSWKREGFRYGPLSALSTKTLELSP